MNMRKNPDAKIPETEDGVILWNVPFPSDLQDPSNLEALKKMKPIIIKHDWNVSYIHSYGQDSPWFAATANGVLLGTQCPNPECGTKYATPKGHCMDCGSETEWFELPKIGRIHTFTVCHFGSQEFLPECPFILALVEWDDVATLFLARLIGLDPQEASLDWIGLPIKAKFRRLSKFKPTDVYFVPVDE